MKTFINNIKYKNQQLSVLRLDIVHPDIQGNKYFKLKYNIEDALDQKKETLLSFGGEYSNHLHALSIAGKVHKMKTIGIIRGEKPLKLNPSLQFCYDNGMKLFFTSRTNFRTLRKLVQETKTVEVEHFIETIVTNFDKKNTFIIPEGGTNALALKGTQEILDLTSNDYDFVCTSIGTAGTIAGVIASANKNTQVLGFPSLKGNFFEKDIQTLLSKISTQTYPNWSLQSSYHFGSFATFNEELIAFNNKFYADYSIPLDTIYTGKMFFGIFDLINQGFFKPTDKILAIHTGGIQGIKSFNEKNDNILNYCNL